MNLLNKQIRTNVGVFLTKSMNKYLIILLLLFFPTQLAYHFWPNWSYVFGLRIDILAPAVYLTDIIVLTILMLNIHTFIPVLKYIAIGIFFMLLNIAVSESPLESVYKWMKFLEFGLLSYFFLKQKVIDSSQLIQNLFYSAVIISVIGILQFFKKSTVGGVLYWLGERSFNSATPGIALFTINGVDYLRAYSIFSHPNSLAGYLAAILILLLLNKRFLNSYLNILGLVLIFICFVLTFSMSAFIALLATLIVNLSLGRSKFYEQLVMCFLFVMVIISLMFPITTIYLGKHIINLHPNISQRIDLAYVSGQVINNKFLFGSGIGTFITEIPKYKGIFSYSWVLQPVHNIFLLIFSELGIFGFLTIFFITKKYIKALLINNNNLIIILVFVFITGLSDHYWITLQQNQLLLSLLIGLSLRYDIHYGKR